VHVETGLLIDDDQPESVAHALGAILADPQRGAAMGRAGRVRAEGCFSAERSVDTVERVYGEIW
jgi:glycosyltransferase involved in cell wall biosynthesis